MNENQQVKADPTVVASATKAVAKKEKPMAESPWSWFKRFCEYLEGAVDEPPAGGAILKSAWVTGLWWTALAVSILIFCGQSSKFIYIDF